MRLQIQIDKPINEALLVEQLQPLAIEIAIHEGYLAVVSDDPAGVLQIYQDHDHTKTSQADLLLGERRSEAQTLRDQAAQIDWDNLTNAQSIAILKKVVYYLVKHIEQEGM
jgi:hypothetical protein